MAESTRNPFLAAALAVLSLTFLAGCRIVDGSGAVEEQTTELDIDGVDTLEVHSGIELHAVIGTSQTVRITGDDNLLSEVAVWVVDQKLVVDWADSNAIYNPSLPMVVEVEVPELAVLHASGGSTVLVGEVETASLAVESSGGASIRFDAIHAPSVRISTSGGGHTMVEALEAADVRLSSSGGGSWELAGSCPELEVSMSGGGDLAAFELEASEVHLDLSSGVHAELSASASISGSASGGSEIVVRGDPELDVSLSGGSTVTPDDS